MNEQPDKNCFTLADGSCVGTDCMHDSPKLTNQERAEKMAAHIIGAVGKATSASPADREWLENNLASQFDEAVLDAFDSKWKNEHKRCLEIEYGQGFASAREKAAGIAEFIEPLIGKEIAERIREMKP